MVLERFLNLLFPRFCVICKQKSSHIDMCNLCLRKLPYIQHACEICGQEMPQNCICAQCLQTPPPFNQTFAPFKYQEPINQLITQLKFGAKLPQAKLLSDLMFEPLQEYYRSRPKPEVIIPVPLHHKRLQERGFNQALEITRPIAKKLQIPIDFNLVKRSKNTMAQSLLSEQDRKTNIKNAFVIKNPVKTHCIRLHNYKHVAVIDDVITTGNTITELCKVLRQNGVNEIDVWCVARVNFKHISEQF